MKELDFERMEGVKGGDILQTIGCAGSIWGAIEYGALLVGLAAGGPLTWVALGTLILAPTFVGLGAATCITGGHTSQIRR